MHEHADVKSLAELRIHPGRWNCVSDLVRGYCERDVLPAAGLLVGRGEGMLEPQMFGRQGPAPDAAPIGEDAIFLVASITKPIVAMGVMLLVERGEILLGDRVGHYIPEFAQKGKQSITIRHLLTHTSGLPDMLPNNVELRTAHAPLSRFVQETCERSPDFPAGRGVQYQSMGYLMLGELIHRITGRTCGEFLQQEIFTPLGMRDTALGAPVEWYDGPSPRSPRFVEIRLPPDQAAAGSWSWNERYWRSLGAPWGGLLTTPADLGRFARMMLGRGTLEGTTLFAPATVSAATCNQLLAMPDIPEKDRRCRPWGLGWRLHWPAHSANFGDLLGSNTYGHWGATGTVLWIDRDHDLFLVFLTSQPLEPHGAYLARVSNAVAASAM